MKTKIHMSFNEAVTELSSRYMDVCAHACGDDCDCRYYKEEAVNRIRFEKQRLEDELYKLRNALITIADSMDGKAEMKAMARRAVAKISIELE